MRWCTEIGGPHQFGSLTDCGTRNNPLFRATLGRAPPGYKVTVESYHELSQSATTCHPDTPQLTTALLKTSLPPPSSPSLPPPKLPSKYPRRKIHSTRHHERLCSQAQLRQSQIPSAWQKRPWGRRQPTLPHCLPVLQHHDAAHYAHTCCFRARSCRDGYLNTKDHARSWCSQA